MSYAIIVSEGCPAGMNVKECLLEMYKFKEESAFEHHPLYTHKLANLYSIDKLHIYAENIDKTIPEDILIFATTHSSKEKVPSLSCHVPGNWGKAELGGKDNQLCIAPALLLKKAYLELKNHHLPDHQVTLEVTHHGPYLEKPVMFIEIGSSKEHWGDRKAGEIIAHTIMKLVDGNDLQNQKVAVGIGGTHYCYNFNKVVERTDIAIGHVCPKHSLEDFSEEMLKQAISQTKEVVDLILIDWKGLGGEKEKIKSIVEKFDIETKKINQILK